MLTQFLYGDEAANKLAALKNKMELLKCEAHNKTAKDMYIFSLNTGTFNTKDTCCNEFKAEIFKVADEILR